MTTGTWNLAGAVLRPRLRGVLGGVLLGALATACGAGLLSLAAWLIATAAQHPSVTALSVAVVLTRALGVGRGVARYAERLVGHDAALRALADMRNRVYARLAATEPVHRFRSGDLVTRLVSDTDSVQDLVVRAVLPVGAAAVVGSGAVLLATALLVPGGVLLAAGLLLAGVAVPAVAAALSRGPAERAGRARARLSTGLVDLLDGAPDLIAYGATDRAVRAVERADTDLTRTARRDAAVLGLGAGAGALVAGLTLAGTLLLGVAAVDAGTLGAVPMAVLVLTALAAFEIVAPLPAAATKLAAVRAGLARLLPVLSAEPAVRHRGPGPAPLPGRGELRIRGLHVAHPEPDGTHGPPVLAGLDLDVAAGEHVALVGASGSGKSTLASVLFRFLDPLAGSVTLGGHELTTRPPDEVRRVVSGVPADPHVFDSTVRENLRLAVPAENGRPATDAELAAVLDRVGLSGLGLDDEVGAHGARLSGGMRRRLALARALLVDPAVLVLDEPTAHLDPDTRDAVLDDLLAAAAGRSVVLITHDPAVLERVRTVHTLRDGRLHRRYGPGDGRGEPRPYPAPNT
ncbi:ATP-binding cassette, subfamily C, CydC [Pseudonocardia ammonioxydans]|uniref:ATP-binding cassette, subfamily C, CydC n=1 Tax=Pseudonocardia ammonioxydans TaxID=260086 RepID=A0A1I4TX66_PSUAM|nr:thiol reductant ABC exporter subunit CydC [Pseudonocardia ammonioxydans]SFM81249.1 ATP-binding cassette, subfamily C, CydC [Pseudonocardia ammonioxydans]